MTYQICELVQEDGQWVQRTRDATAEEAEEIDARKNTPPAPQPDPKAQAITALAQLLGISPSAIEALIPNT